MASACFLPAHHTMHDAGDERCGLEVQAHLHKGIQRTSSLLEAFVPPGMPQTFRLRDIRFLSEMLQSTCTLGGRHAAGTPI